MQEYNQTHKAERAKYNQEHKTENTKRSRKRRQTIKGYLYDRFSGIKQRCNNPNNPRYSRYGGRGIECRFEDAYDFIIHVTIDLKLDTVEKLKGLEIHRINDGHYEKDGIEFLTKAEHHAKHAAMRKLL